MEWNRIFLLNPFQTGIGLDDKPSVFRRYTWKYVPSEKFSASFSQHQLFDTSSIRSPNYVTNSKIPNRKIRDAQSTFADHCDCLFFGCREKRSRTPIVDSASMTDRAILILARIE